MIKEKREYKGKSSAILTDRYISVDIETTGLTTEKNQIIEIGAVKIVDNEITDTFSTLIKPTIIISPLITALTGITNDMVADAPIIEAVMPHFLEFVGDELLLAHNANFDVCFLYDNAMRCCGTPLSNDFIDTLRISRHLFRHFPNHKLSTIIKELGVDDVVEHRAVSDAIQAHLCYQKMKEYVEKNNIDFRALFKK